MPPTLWYFIHTSFTLFHAHLILSYVNTNLESSPILQKYLSCCHVKCSNITTITCATCWWYLIRWTMYLIYVLISITFVDICRNFLRPKVERNDMCTPCASSYFMNIMFYNPGYISTLVVKHLMLLLCLRLSMYVQLNQGRCVMISLKKKG